MDVNHDLGQAIAIALGQMLLRLVGRIDFFSLSFSLATVHSIPFIRRID